MTGCDCFAKPLEKSSGRVPICFSHSVPPKHPAHHVVLLLQSVQRNPGCGNPRRRRFAIHDKQTGVARLPRFHLESESRQPQAPSSVFTAPGLPEPRGRTSDKYLQQKQPIKKRPASQHGHLVPLRLSTRGQTAGMRPSAAPGTLVPSARSISRVPIQNKQAKRSGRRAVIGLELPVHKGPGARD